MIPWMKLRRTTGMGPGEVMAKDLALVTFGETMIRLSPPRGFRLENAGKLIVDVGGAELSVAQAAARTGLRTAWVSALPGNPLGRIVENRVREQGVSTEFIAWKEGGRMGLYFVEFGSSPRPGEVTYDRRASAISRIGPDEIDWEPILRRSRMFHTSGITPALGPGPRLAAERALKSARRFDCLVSYDINYRSKLWSLEEARRVQLPYLDYIDILFTSRLGSEKILGVREKDEASLALKLQEKYGLTACVVTGRSESGTRINRVWAVMAYSGKIYRSGEFEFEVVDRLGGGDSLCAGVLSSFLRGDPGGAAGFGCLPVSSPRSCGATRAVRPVSAVFILACSRLIPGISTIPIPGISPRLFNLMLTCNE